MNRHVLPLIPCFLGLAFPAAASLSCQPDEPIAFNSLWALQITLKDLLAPSGEEIQPLAAFYMGGDDAPLTLGFRYDGHTLAFYSGGVLGGANTGTWYAEPWFSLAYGDASLPLSLVLSRGTSPKNLTLHAGYAVGEEVERGSATWKEMGNSSFISEVELYGYMADLGVSFMADTSWADACQILDVGWVEGSYDVTLFCNYTLFQSQRWNVPEPANTVYLFLGVVSCVAVRRRRGYPLRGFCTVAAVTLERPSSL